MVNLHCCHCERPSKLVGDISQPDLRRIGRISAQGKVEKDLSTQKEEGEEHFSISRLEIVAITFNPVFILIAGRTLPLLTSVLPFLVIP